MERSGVKWWSRSSGTTDDDDEVTTLPTGGNGNGDDVVVVILEQVHAEEFEKGRERGERGAVVRSGEEEEDWLTE